ncbi:hypothetical protein QF042_005075 [Pedobacter sp. W3I1]|nr:hypothetical protein [Pedobacter sp. W3I1]
MIADVQNQALKQTDNYTVIKKMCSFEVYVSLYEIKTLTLMHTA